MLAFTAWASRSAGRAPERSRQSESLAFMRPLYVFRAPNMARRPREGVVRECCEGSGRGLLLPVPREHAPFEHVPEATHIHDVARAAGVDLHLAPDTPDVDLHDLLGFALRVRVVLHRAQDLDWAHHL